MTSLLQSALSSGRVSLLFPILCNARKRVRGSLNLGRPTSRSRFSDFQMGHHTSSHQLVTDLTLTSSRAAIYTYCQRVAPT
ncbi:hypothetical protein OH76DRAFT_1411378 [Lentinus brumalis]|uniref:Uncharacterized protein n=1 Tax=Lentinus brumalis TaxID=2498619 RepID=A0A371CPL1_9APHY|nr:hypothetical protein OH76DRAFT_1411378 [Polyporus brumalis]